MKAWPAGISLPGQRAQRKGVAIEAEGMAGCSVYQLSFYNKSFSVWAFPSNRLTHHRRASDCHDHDNYSRETRCGATVLVLQKVLRLYQNGLGLNTERSIIYFVFLLAKGWLTVVVRTEFD